MRTVTLDVRCIHTPAALQIYLQYALDLPRHYGRNLDALYDVLGEIDEPTRIVLIADQNPTPEMAAYLPRVERVFSDAAKGNRNIAFD